MVLWLMGKMKWAGALILLLATILTAAFFAAPSLLRKSIIAQVNRRCPNCKIELRSVTLGLRDRTLTLRDLEFHGDPAEITTVDAALKELRVRIRPALRFELDGLAITLIDDSEKPAGRLEPSSPHWMSGLPAVKVAGIELQNSRLTYILKIYGKEARLEISQIEAKIGPFGTRQDISPKSVDFALSGRLESSGQAKVSGRVDLFSEDNRDRFSVDLSGLQLSELNPYFAVADGLTLKGRLEQAYATLHLNRGSLTGEMSARYRELDLKFQELPDRGAVKTFLSGLAESVTVVPSRPRGKEAAPTEKISIQRHGESLVKFLLRGLAEAAKKLISKN